MALALRSAALFSLAVYTLLPLGLIGIGLGTVLLPTVLAILYFGPIASDVYISESRFVVRNPQRQAVTSGTARPVNGADS